MASLADKRRQFTETWKCCICHELPISPFQTHCGHCMCFQCAMALPATQAGTRACPVCKDPIPSVKQQPQLAETLETLAELFWPEAWAFWLKLKKIDPLSDLKLFDLCCTIVSEADDDMMSALRTLRFSHRYWHF